MKNISYPNPWDLTYFQEIARTQNLSRAAERLGVGQPALSLSLKRLESQLGIALFVRRSQGLSLTPAGARLLRESNRLRSVWESVVSETKKSESEVVGRYSLGCHPSVALYTLSPLIRDLYSQYPELEIQLRHGLSRTLCEEVISGEIEFGLVVNPVRHPDLVIYKLAADEVCFWRSARGLSDTLIHNPDLNQTQALLKKIKRQGFQRTLVSESLEVISILAKSGAGTAILPTRIVKVMAPELRRVDSLPSFQDEITFVYRSDLPKTAGAKAIIERIKKLSI